MIDLLKTNYPKINFISGDKYSWSSEAKTITYALTDNPQLDYHSLLHELAHSLLDHNRYKNDINLIKIERDAWALTKQLLNEYAIEINNDYIEDCLDTYRDWIYKRAKCPQCSHVGYQCAINAYSCVFCTVSWKVPESRLCMVKRVLTQS